MTIRYANPKDQNWLEIYDPHVSPSWIARCVGHNEILLATVAEQRIGYLRFSYFWGTLPYMDLIWVDAAYRNQGHGTKLLAFWEREMNERGYHTLMTSSMANEPAPQAWHLRNGFVRSGELSLPGVQDVPEVFFVKQIANHIASGFCPPSQKCYTAGDAP